MKLLLPQWRIGAPSAQFQVLTRTSPPSGSTGGSLGRSCWARSGRMAEDCSGRSNAAAGAGAGGARNKEVSGGEVPSIIRNFLGGGDQRPWICCHATRTSARVPMTIRRTIHAGRAIGSVNRNALLVPMDHAFGDLMRRSRRCVLSEVIFNSPSLRLHGTS